jgi:flagellin-like hook-associated protein FlgL
VQLTELIELCTKLVKQVQALEKDLAQTKQHHAAELNQMKAEIKRLKDEVESLKKKRSAKVVFSSSSSPQDEFSAGFSGGLGDSSKQGRKTDAETKGRKIDFGEDYGLDADADFDFDDTVGTT